MKKKLLLTLATTIISILMISCDNTPKTEYDIDELGKLLAETDDLFEEETKNWIRTYGEEGFEVYKKCAEKTGLPFNTEITVCGIKKGVGTSFYIESETNDEYEIYCYSDYVSSPYLFLEEGENVIVKGLINESNASRGSLVNIEVISPEIKIKYEENIADAIQILNEDSYPELVVMGEIKEVLSREEFINFISASPDMFEISENHIFTSFIYILSSKEDNYKFYIECPEPLFKKGDIVAFSGYSKPLLLSSNDEGTQDVTWGFMVINRGYYKFQ